MKQEIRAKVNHVILMLNVTDMMQKNLTEFEGVRRVFTIPLALGRKVKLLLLTQLIDIE